MFTHKTLQHVHFRSLISPIHKLRTVQRHYATYDVVQPKMLTSFPGPKSLDAKKSLDKFMDTGMYYAVRMPLKIHSFNMLLGIEFKLESLDII